MMTITYKRGCGWGFGAGLGLNAHICGPVSIIIDFHVFHLMYITLTYNIIHEKGIAKLRHRS